MGGPIFRIFIVLYTVYYGHFSVYMRYLVPSRCGCVRAEYTMKGARGDETRGHRRKMRLALADVISATV